MPRLGKGKTELDQGGCSMWCTWVGSGGSGNLEDLQYLRTGPIGVYCAGTYLGCGGRVFVAGSEVPRARSDPLPYR